MTSQLVVDALMMADVDVTDLEHEDGKISVFVPHTEHFKAKQALPFELLSDPDETACALFGVMKLKNMYGKQVRGIERSTFVIDAGGHIAREWRGVKVPGHAAEVLADLKNQQK